MHLTAEITKWYENKDVAFAIGVDELNIGGSFRNGPKNEEWDTYYWVRTKNDFWTLYWKPILDENPWVKYSIGWTPSHNSPHNLQNYPEPKGVNKANLTWKSKEGQKWIKEVLKPMFEYGNRHYDEWAGHGYWHEEGINRYYPYWNPTSPLFAKAEWYKTPNFLIKTFAEYHKPFKKVFGHNCTVWNTCPFAANRPDMPALLSRYGIYGLGLWCDVTNQSINPNTGLKETSIPLKSYIKPIGSEVIFEGSMLGHYFKAKVGEMSYWQQDVSIANKGKSPPFKLDARDHIVIAPYSISIEGTPLNFKKRVNALMKNYKQFDAPFLYYFLHAQFNWIDALGGGSIVHRIKEYKGYIAACLSLIVGISSLISLKLALGILGLIGIFGILLTISKIIGGEFYKRIVFAWGYGKNAKRHNNELKWIYCRYKDKLWITTFSEACEYFDLRKKSKVSVKEKKGKLIIRIDSRDSLPWGRRIMPVSLKINGISKINSLNLQNKTKNAGIKIINLPEENCIVINGIPIKPEGITMLEAIL